MGRRLDKLVAVFLAVTGILSPVFLAELARAENPAHLPTSVEVMVSCGDGFAEAANNEICDPGSPPTVSADLGTTTCRSFLDLNGSPYQSGTLRCLLDCSDFDANGCFTCGNSNKESAEECDGSDHGGNTCLSFGFDGGTLVCTPACRLSTVNCTSMPGEGGTPGGGSGSGGASGGANGFNPGSETESKTKIVIKGKAYPHGDVHILIDGKVEGIVRADGKADFYFEDDQIAPGVATFGFWSEDKQGLKSTLMSLTLRVISNAVTTISGVYIAPSIDIDKKNVNQGELIKISGVTIPETLVNVHINSPQEFIERASSTADGQWSLDFDTSKLEPDFHTAKALFTLGATGTNVIKSGFSKSVSFAVGKPGGTVPCPEADLNNDKRVNLTDFSILLYHWGTNNTCADQNQNGSVDLIDFSIMMYYWTG